MTAYNDGRRFEQEVRTDLQADGYWVIRAAGSKTKADLIAIKQGQILIIQCKRGGKIGPAERAGVVGIASMINGVPVVAYKERGRRKPHYDQLTGMGPQDRQPFLTDEVAS